MAPCGAVAAPAGPGVSSSEALLRVPPRDPCWAARLDVPWTPLLTAVTTLVSAPAPRRPGVCARARPEREHDVQQDASPPRGSRLHADLRLQTWEPLGMARLNPEAPRSSHRTGVPLRHPTPGPGLREGWTERHSPARGDSEERAELLVT